MGDAGGEILTDISDGVATLTFNRPDVLNAFTDAMRAEIRDSLRAFATRDDIGCVMVIGAGKAFSAGGDVASMAALQDDNDTQVINDRLVMAAEVLDAIAALPQPLIAAINGAAAGAGMNLALACDMRLASEKAVFAQAFVKIGLVPDWGGFQNLTRIVGTGKAMELMMTGERIDAAEALRLGLVNRVIGRDEFAAETRAFAKALAKGPRDTLAAIKRGVRLGADETLQDVLAFERETQVNLFLSEDAREGMRAFLEKRPAKFSGEKP